MKNFRLKQYVISSDKIKGGPVRIHFLCDLHGGADENYIRRIRALVGRRAPDLVLIGGDMIVSGMPERWPQVQRLVAELSERCPVYYALGNHEQYLTREWTPKLWGPARQELLDFFARTAHLLDNRDAVCTVRGERLHIYGLSLERRYYRKPFPARLTKKDMEEKLGRVSGDGDFTILMAHNPYYGRTYFSWGGDLTLAGHYHGGVMRVGDHFGLISPFFHLFPRYCCGKYTRGAQHMIVSAGLGEHTVPVRIWNPMEIIEIVLTPDIK